MLMSKRTRPPIVRQSSGPKGNDCCVRVGKTRTTTTAMYIIGRVAPNAIVSAASTYLRVNLFAVDDARAAKRLSSNTCQEKRSRTQEQEQGHAREVMIVTEQG